MRIPGARLAAIATLLSLPGAAGVTEPIRQIEPSGAVRWIATPRGQTPAFFARLAEAGIDVPANDRPFERSLAFLVGVSQYSYLEPQLPGVERDIADLRDTLLTVAGFDEVIELTNEHATRDTIEDFLVDEFRNTNPRDRLFIYFAGHGADAGGSTGYFQLQAAKPNVFARHTIEIADATRWSSLIKARHLLIVFDACASGYAFDHRAASPRDEERDALRTFSGRGSRTVITAGTGLEDTLEIILQADGKPTGAFTRSFITALRESDSRFLVLTTDRVFAEAKDHLASILNTADGASMTPRLWDLDTISYGGAFLFLNPSRRQEDSVPPSVITALRARVKEPQPELPVPTVASWREVSVRLGEARLQSSRYGIDLGHVPATEATDFVLQVTNEAADARSIAIRVDDPAIEADWERGSWLSPVEAGASDTLRVRIVPATHGSLPPRREGGITFLSNGVEVASITISYEPLAPRVTREAHSGPRLSGVKKAFSPPYEFCLGPAPAHYTLIAESARFWLTGDRSCGSWSSCDWTRRDDANLCFQFTLQGHDEFPFDDGVRQSEGHLSADYRLVRAQPRLIDLAD